MRHGAQALMVLVLLCVGACAFGQDLRLFRAVGELTPAASWDGKTDKSMVLVYKQRGVVFYAPRGKAGIPQAAVFPPASTQFAAAVPQAIDDLVPGAGARGVMLGVPTEQAKQTVYSAAEEMVEEGSDFATYRIDKKNVLTVNFANGAVSQIHIAGSFRTPEGLTHKSTITDIERLYGRADEYYVVAQKSNWGWLLVLAPVLLVLGLAGFAIRGRKRA